MVLSKFPLYDEVFLLRELAALAERFDLYILSLRPPGDVLVHDQARPLLARHLSPHFLFSKRVVLAQLKALRWRPGAYLRALRRVVARNWRSPKFLLGGLVFFPKAVFLADWARREGASLTSTGAGPPSPPRSRSSLPSSPACPGASPATPMTSMSTPRGSPRRSDAPPL